jgi:hypothetical protein
MAKPASYDVLLTPGPEQDLESIHARCRVRLRSQRQRHARRNKPTVRRRRGETWATPERGEHLNKIERLLLLHRNPSGSVGGTARPAPITSGSGRTRKPQSNQQLSYTWRQSTGSPPPCVVWTRP